MNSVMCILVSIIVSAGPSEAANSLPKAAPPQFGIAVIGEDGDLQISYLDPKPVWETRTREIAEVVDGKRVVRTVTQKVCHHVATPATTTRRAGQFRVFKDGIQLDEQTQSLLLKEPNRVVFKEGIGPLDPFYGSFLRDDTIVVCVTPLKEDVTRPNAPAPAPALSPANHWAPPPPPRADPSA